MADLTQSVLRPELPVAHAALQTGRGWLSRTVLRRWTERLARGALDVTWADGTAWSQGGSMPGTAAHIRVNHPRFVRRIATGGAIGLADSYIDGDWDTPDLLAVIQLGIENEATLSETLGQSLPQKVLGRLRHRLQANTLAGSRRNIATHYDLGNDFYTAWLDETMTYSAALFTEPAVSLAQAQRAKYARIAETASIQPGDHVLEIGCGWGGFALYAARELDCRVTALTLSHEQAAWARRTAAAAGLADRIEIRLEDYRHATGTFDRIVSIEMFEAVGEAYWPDYFAALRHRLRPGGTAALQVITIDDARFDAYRRRPDFIQLRVFPGGMLPSPTAFATGAETAGLTVSDGFDFGPSYAETLRQWRRRFEAASPQLCEIGYDETFRRLWRYYLCYCEAGFAAGTISVKHYRLAPR